MSTESKGNIGKDFFNEQLVRSIFTVAEIPVHNMWELLNGYWQNNETMGPWWLVKTDYGMVRIGWRKRVIDIEFSDLNCSITGSDLTIDDVTKGDKNIHAYSMAKAAEYLSTLFTMIKDAEKQKTYKDTAFPEIPK